MAKGFMDNAITGMRVKRVTPTKRAGAPGTAIYGGYIQPIEESTELTGRAKFKIFSEMLANTCIVGASVRLFTNMIGKAEWKFEPADENNAQAKEIAERMEELLLERMRTPWHRVVRRASMYKFYGFSIQEWTAKSFPELGLIGFDDIEPRPQITIERWDTDENGRLVGVVQRSPQTFEELYIPRAKTVYMVDDVLHDSPEGLGLFRHLVEANRRLLRYEQLEGWGYETDLRGVPVGKGPFQELREMVTQGKLSEEQVAEIEQPMKDFIQNHIRTPQQGMLLDSLVYKTSDERETPSGVPKWTMDLLKSGSSNLGDILRVIQRINREMARVLGTEHLLLGETSTGSHAMAKEKGQSFALTVDSTLKELTESLGDDAVDPIMMMNGWPMELKPKLKTEKMQHRSIEEITGALANLAQAGATFQTSDEAVLEILDQMGLTRPDVMAIAADASLDSDMGDAERRAKEAEEADKKQKQKDEGDNDDMPDKDEEE